MIKKKVNKELSKISNAGFFHLLGANGLIFIAGFASQLLVASILEPADIGRIRLLQTFISIGVLICGLGFNVSIVKLTIDESGATNKSKLLQVSIIATMIMFFIVYIVLLIMNAGGYLSSDNEVIKAVPIYSIFLISVSLQSLFSGYFQGLQLIKKLSAIQGFIKIGSVILIILGTYLMSFQGYVWAVMFSGLLSIIIIFYRIPNEFREIFVKPDSRSNYFLRKSFSLSKFALLANISGTIYTTMDVLCINKWVVDMNIIGFYSFAITLIGVMNILPQTIQQISYTYFAKASQNYEKWISIYRKYNKLNHGLILLVLVIAYFMVPILVHIVFKGKYDNSSVYFNGLIFAWSLQYMNSIKGTALMGQGAFSYNFTISALMLLISIPLYFYLIQKFGINGAIYGKITMSLLDYISTYIIFQYFKFKNKTNWHTT